MKTSKQLHIHAPARGTHLYCRPAPCPSRDTRAEGYHEFAGDTGTFLHLLTCTAGLMAKLNGQVTDARGHRDQAPDSKCGSEVGVDNGEAPEKSQSCARRWTHSTEPSTAQQLASTGSAAPRTAPHRMAPPRCQQCRGNPEWGQAQVQAEGK